MLEMVMARVVRSRAATKMQWTSPLSVMCPHGRSAYRAVLQHRCFRARARPFRSRDARTPAPRDAVGRRAGRRAQAAAFLRDLRDDAVARADSSASIPSVFLITAK